MTWIQDAIFYHIYPLGLCGAPHRNDFAATSVPRLTELHGWIPHLRDLGVNALYIGPLFESTAHGYDTAHYFHVDRRLGDNETLRYLAQNLKQNGIRLVLDAVFNHVGRDFWAFRDVQQHGQNSAYCDWFYQLDFTRKSPKGDAFAYHGWAGHYDLVKLNLANPAVRQHLFDAVTFWVQAFDIDGLRLDAADQFDADFMRALATHCRSLKADFWLVGEVVHGDYRQWANADMLDSTTNYECYKGLYSSHVDCNYFEIAYSLNRLFGAEGIYRDLLLYNFADNHDVNRVASSLTEPAHLYPLYGLLFTMPGIPSVYYGSEWGIAGERTPTSDRALRPRIDISRDSAHFPHPDLSRAIQRLAALRQALPALRLGTYQQISVAHEQLVFSRQTADQTVIVAVNASRESVTITLDGITGKVLRDHLNPPDQFTVYGENRVDVVLPPHWLRVMVLHPAAD